MAQSRLQNRNVIAGAKRTSMRLEPEIWAAIADLCRREGIDEREAIRRAQAAYVSAKLTSAVRIYTLEYFRGALARADGKADPAPATNAGCRAAAFAFDHA